MHACEVGNSTCHSLMVTMLCQDIADGADRKVCGNLVGDELEGCSTLLQCSLKKLRSLLSSTDSGWNLVESRQFPEF